MAYTFNGIGTKFYGLRDFRKDGTYVTTEWIVFVFFPIVPIRSLRVRHLGRGEHSWNPFFSSSTDCYAIFEKNVPDWKQVLCTYSYVAFVIGWFCFVCPSVVQFFSPYGLNTGLDAILFFIMCIIPIPTPWILRHYAKKQVYERHGA